MILRNYKRKLHILSFKTMIGPIEKEDQFWERNDSRKNKINPSNLINWVYITNNWYENKYTNKNIHSLKYKNWIKIHHKITGYLNLLCCCEIKMQDFVVNDYN